MRRSNGSCWDEFGEVADGLGVLGGDAEQFHDLPGSLLLNHLTEAVAALDLHLTGDEVRALQEPYTPHGPSWF